MKNIVPSDAAGTAPETSAPANGAAEETASRRADPSDGAPDGGVDPTPDPWQALLQVGTQFIAALATANDPAAAPHPWIERDPATGAQNLKVPLPPPAVAGQLANALVALADSLRGKMT
jgi:hypothetical protein